MRGKKDLTGGKRGRREVEKNQTQNYIESVTMKSFVFRLKNLTDKDRVTERRVSLLELVDFMQKHLTKPAAEVADHPNNAVVHVR